MNTTLSLPKLSIKVLEESMKIRFIYLLVDEGSAVHSSIACVK